ncbi:hypothetical protein [Hymenobacter ruber]
MTADQLTIGTVLKSLTESKVTRTIEDFRPAEGRPFRQWFINSQWLNYAEIDARFSLFKPKQKPAAPTVLTAR